MDVQLQQLVYFVAVAEERHFTRAAERSHVAQPSLSKQIANLERELGASLLNRARGNVSLTPEGEALLPLARRILADVDTAKLEVHELVGLRRGRVRLGATPSLSTVILPSALRTFRDRYPGVELFVDQDGSRGLVRKLADGALDLALIIMPLQSHDPSLLLLPLLREPLVVATARAGGPKLPRRLRVRDLGRLPLVMFRDGYDLRDVTLAALRRARVRASFAVEGGEMDAVLAFVEAGLGVAVVPSMVLADRRALRSVPFAPPGLARTAALAHRRDVAPTRAAREFRDTLVDGLSRAHHDGTLPPGVTLAGGRGRR